MRTDTRKQINDINKAFNGADLSTKEFFQLCPYSLEQLQSQSRQQEIVAWRQLGMVVDRMNGNTLSAVSERFNRDHSTALYAIHSVSEALKGYGSRAMQEAISTIHDYLDTKRWKPRHGKVQAAGVRVHGVQPAVGRAVHVVQRPGYCHAFRFGGVCVVQPH